MEFKNYNISKPIIKFRNQLSDIVGNDDEVEGINIASLPKKVSSYMWRKYGLKIKLKFCRCSLMIYIKDSLLKILG